MEREPERIDITDRHVYYAFELLNHRFGGRAPEVPLRHPSETSKTFQDFRCPAGRLYIVNVSWDKARPGGVQAGTDALDEA
jgi:hypothetical protein